jgi:urease gamma subunit
MKTTKGQTGQSKYIEELLKNGTTVLQANTREELAEMINEIPADCRYMSGAVGRTRDNGTYTLRVDIIN